MSEILDINFLDFKKQAELMAISIGWFEAITGLPVSIRGADKNRTGIRVNIGDMDNEGRNFTAFSAFKPSEFGIYFAAEKVARMRALGEVSSANSANDKLRFPGAIAVTLNGYVYSCGVSGLRSEEDVFIAVMNLSCALQMSPWDVCANVRQHGGVLPDCFMDIDHYLHAAVNSMRVEDCLPHSLAA
ncbi:MAG: hypothetical protein WC453_01850 [Patescibacteria group bacterium]